MRRLLTALYEWTRLVPLCGVQLPYEVTTPDSASTLLDFQTNANVAILRDSVGADLVQLVSDFDNSCGRS